MTSILEVEQLDTLSSNASSTLTIGGTNTTTIAFGPNVTTTPSSLKNKYPFKAVLSSDQTGINHDSFTKVSLASKSFDPDSKFDTSNYRYIPAETGYYYLTGSIGLEKVLYNFRRVGVAIYKNGSEQAFNWIRLSGSSDIIEEQYISVSILDYSSSTSDYYELYVYQNNASGGNSGSLKSSTARTYFTGFKLIQ